MMIDARKIVDRVGREHRLALVDALRMIRDASDPFRDDLGTPMAPLPFLDELIADLEVMR